MRKALLHLKKKDPVIRGVIESVGPYRIQYREPDFDTLVRSIIYQQISGNVAKAIVGRLVEAIPGGVLTPGGVLELPQERLKGCGLSKAKAEYVRDLARRTDEGSLVFEALPEMEDAAVIEALTQVKGIGVWTAQMFLIFALQRHDVLPTGDLGIRKAMQNCYGLAELPKPGTMEELAAPWRPYCSVATWYLWRSLDGPAAL